MKKGIIFNIKKFAVHDGPGIRQTIFLKGCPLKCWWCHNPESIEKEIFQYEKVNKFSGMEFLSPENIGKEYSVSELFEEIEKDKIFFEESGGGVSFSGGEPFLQADFLLEIVKKCKQNGIHVTVDTSGFVSQDLLKKFVPFVDLFLYDLKFIDEAKHLKYTGVSNEIILQNLSFLKNKNLLVRFPMIPTINDSKEDLTKLADFLKKNNCSKLEILPFHYIGKSKYERFNFKYKLGDLKEPTDEEVKKVMDFLKEKNLEVILN